MVHCPFAIYALIQSLLYMRLTTAVISYHICLSVLQAPLIQSSVYSFITIRVRHRHCHIMTTICKASPSKANARITFTNANWHIFQTLHNLHFPCLDDPPVPTATLLRATIHLLMRSNLTHAILRSQSLVAQSGYVARVYLRSGIAVHITGTIRTFLR